MLYGTIASISGLTAKGEVSALVQAFACAAVYCPVVAGMHQIRSTVHSEGGRSKTPWSLTANSAESERYASSVGLISHEVRRAPVPAGHHFVVC